MHWAAPQAHTPEEARGKLGLLGGLDCGGEAARELSELLFGSFFSFFVLFFAF